MAIDDIVDVSGWPVVSQEFRGDDRKDWASPPHAVTSDNKGDWWLYKPAKSGRATGYRRYDDVAEFVASRLAALIGLPAAQVRLAVGQNAEGIISRNVASDGWDMISGDSLLAECEGYVSIAGDERPRDRPGHTIANIRSVLADMGGPLDSACGFVKVFEASGC